MKISNFDKQNSQKQYNCIICSQETSQSCTNCKRVFYCSTKCTAKDYPTHRAICRKTLNQYLIALLKFHSTFRCNAWDCQSNINLSKTSHYNDKQEFIKIRSITNNGFCILCEKDIEYKGPLGNLRIQRSFNKYGFNSISYLRCVSCNNENSILCIRCFKPKKKCQNDEYKRLLYYWYVIRHYLILDISKILVQYYCKTLYECDLLLENDKEQELPLNFEDKLQNLNENFIGNPNKTYDYDQMVSYNDGKFTWKKTIVLPTNGKKIIIVNPEQHEVAFQNLNVPIQCLYCNRIRYVEVDLPIDYINNIEFQFVETCDTCTTIKISLKY